MDCKKLYIVFTFSFLPKKSKTCLMWHVFAPLLGEFFITEPLTHLLHWSIFFSPVKLCHSLAKFTQKGRDTPPPPPEFTFHLSFGTCWNVTEQHGTQAPTSWVNTLTTKLRHKMESTITKHISFCSEQQLKKQTGTTSFRPHIQVCLLDITGSAC